MPSPPDGPARAPSGWAGSAPEDWALALVLGLYPLVGLALAAGDALTLFGVAILLGVGVRLPESAPLRRPLLSSGVCVLLVLLCLLLPSADGVLQAAALPPEGLSRLVRLLLAGVLALALLRGACGALARRRGIDGGAALVGAGAAGTAMWLATRGEIEAAKALTGLVVSVGLVFGIYRLHLHRSGGLPMLARAGALGAFGAALVALARGGVA